MQNLKNSLRNNLKGAKKIAILGVGSELRADDAAGILIAQELEKIKKPKIKVFLGHTAPENLTGEIRKFAPSHLLIIDSAEMGKDPGEVMMFTPEDAGGISFSTHKLPMKLMAKYLSEEIKCRVLMIGVQPKTLEFGKAVSKEISGAVKDIVNLLKDSFFGILH
jgi:hydrogenase 3 maturation protease